MKLKLIVTEPFTTRLTEGAAKSAFVRGDEITEAADMKAVLASHPGHVTKINAEPPEGDPAFADATADARKQRPAEDARTALTSKP